MHERAETAAMNSMLLICLNLKLEMWKLFLHMVSQCESALGAKIMQTDKVDIWATDLVLWEQWLLGSRSCGKKEIVEKNRNRWNGFVWRWRISENLWSYSSKGIVHCNSGGCARQLEKLDFIGVKLAFWCFIFAARLTWQERTHRKTWHPGVFAFRAKDSFTMSKGQRHSWSIRTRSGAVQFQMCNLDAKAGLYLHVLTKQHSRDLGLCERAEPKDFYPYSISHFISRDEGTASRNCETRTCYTSDLVFVKLLKRWHLVAKLTRSESTWKNSKLKPSWNHYVKHLETHYYILWLRLRDYLEVNSCCLPALGMSWSWFTNRTICALFSKLHVALKILSLSLIL